MTEAMKRLLERAGGDSRAIAFTKTQRMSGDPVDGYGRWHQHPVGSAGGYSTLLTQNELLELQRMQREAKELPGVLEAGLRRGFGRA